MNNIIKDFLDLKVDGDIRIFDIVVDNKELTKTITIEKTYVLLDMCYRTYDIGKDLYDELLELYIDRFHEQPHINSLKIK